VRTDPLLVGLLAVVVGTALVCLAGLAVLHPGRAAALAPVALAVAAVLAAAVLSAVRR